MKISAAIREYLIEIEVSDNLDLFLCLTIYTTTVNSYTRQIQERNLPLAFP